MFISSQRLQREVRVWDSLFHPNVVMFFGWTVKCIKDNVSIGLVSEWCENGDVRRYLHNHPNADRRHLVGPLRTAWYALCDIWKVYDVSQGLAYLHSKDIIHGCVHSVRQPFEVSNWRPRLISLL